MRTLKSTAVNLRKMKIAINAGLKVRHIEWDKDSFIKKVDGKLVDEKNAEFDEELFLSDWFESDPEWIIIHEFDSSEEEWGISIMGTPPQKRNPGRSRKLSDNDCRELIRLYGAGYGITDLAKRYKISRASVYNNLKRPVFFSRVEH